MTTGIFALVGVITGGLLNGFVTWRLERARAKAALRADARLILEELAANHGRLAYARRGGASDAFILRSLTSEVWDQHRPAMAHGLSDAEWGHVTMAYRSCETARGFGKRDGDLNEIETRFVSAAIGVVGEALDMLGRRAVTHRSHTTNWEDVLRQLDLDQGPAPELPPSVADGDTQPPARPDAD